MNLPVIQLSHLSTGAGRPVLTDYRSHEWYVLTERYTTGIYRPTDTMDEIDVLLVTAPVTAERFAQCGHHDTRFATCTNPVSL